MRNKKGMQRKIQLLFISLLVLAGTTGCNTRESVSLSSVDEVTEYVESVIDEPVEYVETTQYVEHGWAYYTYRLVDRDIEFRVEAAVFAEGFEALQLSDFREDIEIHYEEAIMQDDYYVEERLKLAEKYGVSETFHGDGNTPCFWTKFDKFQELENLVQYLVEVDKLYSFKEKKPKKVEHININIKSNCVGAIYPTKHGGSFTFSKTQEDEIDEEDFLERLQIFYVFFGDFRGKRDETVPVELWNELLEKSE